MSLGSLLKLTLAVLLVATATGQILRRLARSQQAVATVANVNLRIAAWWVLCLLVGLALALGNGTAVAVFALFSSLAFAELTRMIGVSGPDRRELFGMFFAFTAAQYGLVWSGRYEVFSILIPVCAFIYIPVRAALAGHTDRFLERTAKIAWALMLCTYCLSYAPALLTLDIPGYAGRNATLLFYFLLVVQSSDVLQYCWGKLFGRRRIASRISPNKTWEGFAGGVLTSTALGVVLYRATPFRPWQAAVICAIVTLAGFAGGLTMSAIKRERGAKDFGALVIGHGGVLDRLDSVCLSAPVFFYLVRYFYAAT
jgi:phosphatidate cytidylyltransferase